MVWYGLFWVSYPISDRFQRIHWRWRTRIRNSLIRSPLSTGLSKKLLYLILLYRFPSSSPFYRFTTRISLHWKTDTCTLGIPKRSSNSRIPMRKSMKLKDTHLKPLLPNTSPPEKWFSLEVTITQYSSIIGMSSIRPSWKSGVSMAHVQEPTKIFLIVSMPLILSRRARMSLAGTLMVMFAWLNAAAICLFLMMQPTSTWSTMIRWLWIVFEEFCSDCSLEIYSCHYMEGDSPFSNTYFVGDSIEFYRIGVSSHYGLHFWSQTSSEHVFLSLFLSYSL